MRVGLFLHLRNFTKACQGSVMRRKELGSLVSSQSHTNTVG